MATYLIESERRDLDGRRPTTDKAADPPGLNAAFCLSGVIAILMLVASLAGLLVHGLYPDDPWAREALRGGDLTTIAMAAPVLVVSMLLARRGFRAAQAIWLGALAYSVYNYAYYVFGAAFNDIFVLHMALFSLSIAALVSVIANIDVATIATRFRGMRGARFIGAFLAVVGTVLGSLWVSLAIRFSVTGQLIAGLPREGVHLVFAIDTSLLAPALVMSGILLWRRSPRGFVFGTAMAVMGALYQMNLLMAGLFQSSAGVPGVKAFPVEGVVLASGFALATLMLLRPHDPGSGWSAVSRDPASRRSHAVRPSCDSAATPMVRPRERRSRCLRTWPSRRTGRI
jgi:hypothetical protein